MYAEYARQFGLVRCALFFATLLFMTGGLETASNLWLASWTADGPNSTVPVEERVIVYGALGVTKCTCDFSLLTTIHSNLPRTLLGDRSIWSVRCFKESSRRTSESRVASPDGLLRNNAAGKDSESLRQRLGSRGRRHSCKLPVCTSTNVHNYPSDTV